MLKNLLLAILFIFPMAANAHSSLSSSSPKNGEILNVLPAEIIMEFKSPVKLVKVELTKSKDKRGKNFFLGGLFGDDDGGSLPLGTSFLMSIDKRQVIPLPPLEEGNYSLSWRAMGEDGHVIKGDLTFYVKGG